MHSLFSGVFFDVAKRQISQPTVRIIWFQPVLPDGSDLASLYKASMFSLSFSLLINPKPHTGPDSLHNYNSKTLKPL